MKNLKSKVPYLIGSLMVLTMAISPLQSFAQEKENNSSNKNDNYGAYRSSQAHTTNAIRNSEREDNQSKSNSSSNSSINKSIIRSNNDEGDDNNENENEHRIIPTPTPTPTPTGTTTVTGQSPVISGITAPTVLGIGQTGTWTINASDPQNGPLSYSVNWGDNVSALLAASVQPVFVQTATFTHSYASAGTYNVTFTVKDNTGLTAISTVTVSVTSSGTGTTTPAVPIVIATPPVISNAIAVIGTTSANVSWTTDVPANTEVFYSTSTPVVIGNSTTTDVLDSRLLTSHVMNITGLTNNTRYYMLIRSTNAGSGVTTSAQFSFVAGM